MGVQTCNMQMETNIHSVVEAPACSTSGKHDAPGRQLLACSCDQTRQGEHPPKPLPHIDGTARSLHLYVTTHHESASGCSHDLRSFALRTAFACSLTISSISSTCTLQHGHTVRYVKHRHYGMHWPPRAASQSSPMAHAVHALDADTGTATAVQFTDLASLTGSAPLHTRPRTWSRRQGCQCASSRASGRECTTHDICSKMQHPAGVYC